MDLGVIDRTLGSSFSSSSRKNVLSTNLSVAMRWLMIAQAASGNAFDLTPPPIMSIA